MRSQRTTSQRPGARRSKEALLALLLLVAVAAALAWCVEMLDVPPRVLASYLEQRATGHGAAVRAAGEYFGALLVWLDPPEGPRGRRPELRIGAQAAGAEPITAIDASQGRLVLVASAPDALRAIEQAQPGDVITFAPGTYRFSGPGISVNRLGTAASGIMVRAERPGTVLLEFDIGEGFAVSVPYWTFENLNIRGVCAAHSDCEHAFHVIAGAAHFVARNNTVTDFNAHFKINGMDGDFPDDGLIEGNTLNNTSVRETDSSVTPIDLVAASRWRVRNNWISDFAKGWGDRVSYGAFAKGGGTGNSFERNIVQCEQRLRGVPGQRVGLSLGGGSTGKQYCRDARCVTEQDGSSALSNLILSCSDDGIYVNRSATSQVRHNTLLDTGGISVRFVESSADVEGNLVDGAIRGRDGAA